jgi:phosphoacetylglucosamine mutase
LSDLLLVDAILYIKGWDLRTWNGLYDDLPSRQCKVKVKDRSLVVTNDNETMSIKPTSLQPALQSAMDGLSSGMNHSSNTFTTTTTTLAPPRTFVRPSGTENVVRVYAEASTQKDADTLASEAAALVYTLCNGVGDIPNFIGKSNL